MTRNPFTRSGALRLDHPLGDLGEAAAVAVVGDGLALVGAEPAAALELGRAVYARVSGHPCAADDAQGVLRLLLTLRCK